MFLGVCEEQRVTYYFDAVAGRGGERPGAGLLAGIFIWPVGTGDGTAHTGHCVIAASCNDAHPAPPRKNSVRIFAEELNAEFCQDTLFAVVLVLVQHKAAPALAAVAPEGVDAFVLTAAVFLGALVFV